MVEINLQKCMALRMAIVKVRREKPDLDPESDEFVVELFVAMRDIVSTAEKKGLKI